MTEMSYALDVADPQQYLKHFPRFVKAFAGKAFIHESAYYVDGYLGAAL